MRLLVLFALTLPASATLIHDPGPNESFRSPLYRVPLIDTANH